MAFLMALLVLGVIAITGMSYDAGVWYFDHRTAQNQAEAAALAAAIELPAVDTTAATTAADEYLEKNGAEKTAGPGCPANDDHSHIEFQDLTGDTIPDAVTVCVRRQSPGAFSKLSGINFVHVSASAKARIGPVTSANVMPWAVVPPDINCGPGETCPIVGNPGCAFADCPYAIDPDKLIVFKQKGGEAVAPGNFGAILACEKANFYEDCIAGRASDGFFSEGGNVSVGSDTGSNAKATFDGLERRYSTETSHGTCDVAVKPDASSGRDPAGHSAAQAKYTAADAGICARRLVLVPIVEAFDNGSNPSMHVLGVATFAIVGWDRTNPYNDAQGTAGIVCGGTVPNKTPAYSCGSVWGFFIKDAIPPDFLLNQIGDTDNPFAPLLIALVD
jgi:hypothetical protein